MISVSFPGVKDQDEKYTMQNDQFSCGITCSMGDVVAQWLVRQIWDLKGGSSNPGPIRTMCLGSRYFFLAGTQHSHVVLYSFNQGPFFL